MDPERSRLTWELNARASKILCTKDPDQQQWVNHILCGCQVPGFTCPVEPEGQAHLQHQNQPVLLPTRPWMGEGSLISTEAQRRSVGDVQDGPCLRGSDRTNDDPLSVTDGCHSRSLRLGGLNGRRAFPPVLEAGCLRWRPRPSGCPKQSPRVPVLQAQDTYCSYQTLSLCNVTKYTVQVQSPPFSTWILFPERGRKEAPPFEVPLG